MKRLIPLLAIAGMTLKIIALLTDDQRTNSLSCYEAEMCRNRINFTHAVSGNAIIWLAILNMPRLKNDAKGDT